MPMTDQELKFALDNEEPRYEELAARLDESDIPRLRELAESDDAARATKAVYLASLLGANDIVVDASRSDNELVRLASASALPNLSANERERVAEGLIEDPNPAVSKLVLRAIDAPSQAFAPRLRELEERSEHPEIRELARQKLQEGE